MTSSVLTTNQSLSEMIFEYLIQSSRMNSSLAGLCLFFGDVNGLKGLHEMFYDLFFFADTSRKDVTLEVLAPDEGMAL